jgi:hypothetical protein
MKRVDSFPANVEKHGKCPFEEPFSITHRFPHPPARREIEPPISTLL